MSWEAGFPSGLPGLLAREATLALGFGLLPTGAFIVIAVPDSASWSLSPESPKHAKAVLGSLTGGERFRFVPENGRYRVQGSVAIPGLFGPSRLWGDPNGN